MLVEYWGLFRFPIGARWVELLPFEGRACLYDSPELLDRTHRCTDHLVARARLTKPILDREKKFFFYVLTVTPK